MHRVVGNWIEDSPIAEFLVLSSLFEKNGWRKLCFYTPFSCL